MQIRNDVLHFMATKPPKSCHFMSSRAVGKDLDPLRDDRSFGPRPRDDRESETFPPPAKAASRRLLLGRQLIDPAEPAQARNAPTDDYDNRQRRETAEHNRGHGPEQLGRNAGLQRPDLVRRPDEDRV